MDVKMSMLIIKYYLKNLVKLKPWMNLILYAKIVNKKTKMKLLNTK